MAGVAGGPVSQEPPAEMKEGPAKARRASASFGATLRERVLGLREGSIIVVTLVAAVYFSLNTSSFLTGGNFKTLLPYFAPFAILAAGEVFVMILGEIDLSIGAMYLFAPFVFYKLTTAGIPLVPSVLLALLCCMVVGALNGFFVAIVGINSFVTTLGMLFAFEGLALIISHGEPVAIEAAQLHQTHVAVHHIVNGHNIVLTETVNHLGTFAKIFGGGTYSELIWALAIVVILQIVLTFTRWGLYTVAIGSNKLGAAEAGVGVKGVMIRNFVLCALTAGLVGILEAVRAGSVQPDPAGANEILFFAIAAAVIGGTLLAGGSGTVVGALIGALFLGILKDGLVLQGTSTPTTCCSISGSRSSSRRRSACSSRARAGGTAAVADQSVSAERVVGPISAPDDVLRVEHIAKRFGPVTALRDVNLHLRKGEVLGLLGDNGAGKSTLIKILCGFQKQDSGQMFLHGEPFQPKSVDDARSQGIETVYQDLALIDELSVYHNLFLRRERVHRPLPLLANRQMKREARVALDEIGINIPRIDVAVARLSGGQRQAIAVARTVNSDADVILLDEPLAAMGVKEGALILDLDRAPEGRGPRLDHRDPAQLRPGVRGLRPRQHDPGRHDRARQADRGDLRG